MSKKRKHSRLGQFLLISYTAIGAYSLLAAAIYLNFFVTPVEAKAVEQVARPVVLKPLAQPLPKLTKSQKIVATAHLGEDDNWGETLDQAYRRGWRP